MAGWKASIQPVHPLPFNKNQYSIGVTCRHEPKEPLSIWLSGVVEGPIKAGNHPKDVVTLWGTMSLSRYDIAETHPYTDLYSQDIDRLVTVEPATR